jgi:limonene-1,2-epoxide hydrolase
MRLIAVIALVVALLPSACGGDDDAQTTTSAIPGGADPESVEVIDNWATALREGDVDGAADYFAIPSVVQNAGPAIEIADVADARAFNASLPCGAELIRAEPDGDLVLATFRLTERPGPGTCGSGVGETAQTAFLIEDGEIVEWRRVITDEELAPEAPSSST